MIINRPKKKKQMCRYTVMRIIAGCIIGTVILRMLYLQAFSYEDYKEKANTTSIRFASETAPRGEIVAQNGVVLATNKRTYSLTYTETKEVKEKFYTTMSELFKILDRSNESIQDAMLLRLNDDGSMYFSYNTTDEEGHRYEELRFKKDRGLNEEIQKKLYPTAKELKPEQNEKIDEELLKISPEETFYKLVKLYDLVSLAEPDYKKDEDKKKSYEKLTGEELTEKIINAGYSLQEIKRYMVVKDIIKMQSFKNNTTVTIVNNISKDTVLTIKQKLTDIPGIDVSSVPIREYPFKNLGSSVIGYVSSIDSSQESQYTLRGYDPSTDLIGKAGIESAFEDQLKGVKGGTTVRVNSSGRVNEKLFELESHPGNNVNLTIDAGLQWASEKALEDTIKEIRETKIDNEGHTYKNATRGALVAVEVNTGRILSLVSYPDYDPNLFTVPGTLSEEESARYFSPDLNKFGSELIQRLGLQKSVEELFENGQDTNDLYARPFYNYATMSLIPPGSTFKPLTGIAGLESGTMKIDTTVYATGTFDMHDDLYKKGSKNAPTCLGKSQGGHKDVNIAKALEVSCNIYFYETAYQMYHKAILEGKTNVEALDCIAEYAWKFGLGADPNNSNANLSTGIEIGENFGQCYNFKSYKNQSILYSKYKLVDFLERGDYNGITFVPFDIKVNDEDIDEVKNSKARIKEYIADELMKVGTGKIDETEFDKTIKKEVQNIMKYSDTYKARVANAGRTVNLESEASQITYAIKRFVVYDLSAEITTPGELISASIGQSSNTFTPLQLASYAATIANGGTRYKLHLVDSVTDTNGNIVQEYGKEVLNNVNISQSTLEAVKYGMSKVNNDENGTAMTAFKGFPESIGTAGKTGSADFAENQYERGRAPYGVYISFAPINDPQIAVAAIVFDGGHGGYVAPAIRGVYDYYFRDRIKEENPAYTSDFYVKYVENNPFVNSNTNNNESDNTQKKTN